MTTPATVGDMLASLRFPLAERARTLADKHRQTFAWLAMHRGSDAALAAYPAHSAPKTLPR